VPAAGAPPGSKGAAILRAVSIPSVSRFVLVLAGVCLLGHVGCRGAEPTSSVDLVGLFGLAELETETEVVDFGAAEARAFLLEGWSFNQKAPGGRDFVWGLGARSVLRLVVGEPRDLRLRFRVRAGVSPEEEAQRLEVVVSGQSVGTTHLRRGAAWYSVPVPGSLLVPGENQIEFRYHTGEPEAGQGESAADSGEFAADSVEPDPVEVEASWGTGRIDDPERRSVAFERLEVKGAASLGLASAVVDASDPVLRIPFRSSVAYYLRLPEGGELSIAQLRSWPEGGVSGRLEVEVEPAGVGVPVRTLLQPGTDRQGVSLAPFATAPIRLLLRATPEGELGESPAGLELVAPTLKLPGGTKPGVEPRPLAETLPNVFIYMIDTLRPDHLGIYGYSRPTSPHIDAFAQDATLFLDAVAQTSWTRPAVASIFTGLNPPSHGVVRADRALAEDLASLPEVLQGLGYQTWGIITNGNVAPAFGFGRGFDRYDYMHEGQPVEMHQLSDRVNERLFGWLDAREQDGPLMAYLHTTDPHSPYTPRSPYREQLAGAVRDPEAGSRPYMRRLQLGEAPAPGTQQRVRALYDAEIAFNDASFGAFIAKLKQLGLYEGSLIILLSDHGEAFAEHGSWQHGSTLYDEVVAIPLVIKFPKGGGRGEVVTTTARQVDVLPTVLDVLQSAQPPGLEGRSLLPEADGGRGPMTPVTAFSYLTRRRGEWESVSQGRRKLIRTTAVSDGSEHVRLFELESDPRERVDMAPQRPVWRGYLLSQLRHLEGLPRREEEAPGAKITPELRERLEALGYM
jgi:arylsulfatase A-like enzyme